MRGHCVISHSTCRACPQGESTYNVAIRRYVSLYEQRVKSSRPLCSRKGTYDKDSFAFDIVVPEQPEVVPDSSRESEIIRLGPRVDRKQGYTKHPGDAADVQY